MLIALDLAMKLPEPFSWTREEARSGKFDGKFLIGVRTTGIYCLPSCPTHPPKKENVTLYRTEAECQAAGLARLQALPPGSFLRGRGREYRPVRRSGGAGSRAVRRISPTPQRLARGAGRQPDQAGRICSANMPIWRRPQWLRRERVRHAAELLLAGNDKVVDVGFAAGFESEFGVSPPVPGADADDAGRLSRPVQCLSAAAARRLPRQGSAGLSRPRSRKPVREKRGQQDLESAPHRRWPGGPGIVAGEGRRLGTASMPTASLAAPAWRSCMKPRLRCWASTTRRAPFETRHAEFTAPRRGLRLPNIPTGFDGLAWGIIGQQINVKFASSLRSEIIRMAGEKDRRHAGPSHAGTGGRYERCGPSTSGASPAPRRPI